LKNLEIDRPIAFLDVETTGLSVSADRIVEMSILKVEPDGSQEQKTRRFNPGRPIGSGATEVHGITDKDVADEPEFRQVAAGLRSYLEGCDIAGFGVSRFDLPLLEAEFRRARVEFSREGRRVIDTMVIYHTKEPRDLSAAYARYTGKEIERPHAAEDDARAAAEVLDAQLALYPDLPKTAAALHRFCNPDQDNWVDPDGRLALVDGEVTINFGQHKGESLKDVAEMEPDYLKWVLDQDFSGQVRAMVAAALDGELPSSPEPDESELEE
jgi:DNA polymerase III subunit epsilon